MANITMYGDCSKKSIITGSKNIADGVRIWKTATFGTPPYTAIDSSIHALTWTLTSVLLVQRWTATGSRR
jgi:hypothetical protein